YFKEHNTPNLHPFYWEVAFRKKDGDKTRIIVNSNEEVSEDEVIKLHFSPDGHFLSLINADNLLPQQLVDRSALAAAFPSQHDSAYAVLTQFNDTVLIDRLTISLDFDERRDSEKDR